MIRSGADAITVVVAATGVDNIFFGFVCNVRKSFLYLQTNPILKT